MVFEGGGGDVGGGVSSYKPVKICEITYALIQKLKMEKMEKMMIKKYSLYKGSFQQWL